MNKMNKNRILTYISLFSGAGIGCYGFYNNGFRCVATVEKLKKRLIVQKFNDICLYESAYICGDLKEYTIKDKIRNELYKWENNNKNFDLDVIIATPPCQGMSVANHKKKNEKNRNSLVVESIILTKEIKPKFFVFENVRSFLNTVCTDIDGQDKKIKDAIEENLSGDYNVLWLFN